ncbi:hypothetical protein Tco_0600940 [Tanacetum coccineum]
MISRTVRFARCHLASIQGKTTLCVQDEFDARNMVSTELRADGPALIVLAFVLCSLDHERSQFIVLRLV